MKSLNFTLVVLGFQLNQFCSFFKAKLAKKLVSFQADEIAYTNFWHKMDKWMKDKKGQIERNFKHYDIEEDGVVPFHIFKAGNWYYVTKYAIIYNFQQNQVHFQFF